MTRPLTARIDLNAFRQNYLTAKRLHGGKAMAVIKANAYGHGAIECAKAIEDEADAFAVASIGEAIALREAGIVRPILLLEGFFDATELPEVIANDCWLVMHSAWQVEALVKADLARPISVWLKVDTGMHRLGFSPNEIPEMYAQLDASEYVDQITLMTHFANADNVVVQHTVAQIDIFSELLQSLTVDIESVSLSNSAAILAWNDVQKDMLKRFEHDADAIWSRPGIMLYGANPLINTDAIAHLFPVMELVSKVIAVQTIQAGESIGYGSLFTADRTTRVGIVACGYADGYPRIAKHAPVMVAGVMTRTIGRVSMDMLFVDMTDIPDASIGAIVELWGKNVLANAVAETAGTNAYELFCNVKRARFEYNNA